MIELAPIAFPLTVTLLLWSATIETVVGYPAAVFKRIGHPVTWIGALIAGLERRLNRPHFEPPTRRTNGLATLFILLTVVMGVAGVVQSVIAWLSFGDTYIMIALMALAGSSALASRSLHSHVADVASALDAGGLIAGRQAVGMIVGRNTEALDEAGVARAAIESLAENYADGVIAPSFWMMALGLPGAFAYKAINTADSMIGHRTLRYRDFGWASARLDDLVNLPASRLTALFIVLAAGLRSDFNAGGALRAVWRDASKHKSPNAGWPEAAMAGALGLRLAGPRVYGTELVNDHWMGQGRAEATTEDIRRALSLYRTAQALFLMSVATVALLVSI
jgi:adenosylcobinamide-phosphate synthase